MRGSTAGHVDGSNPCSILHCNAAGVGGCSIPGIGTRRDRTFADAISAPVCSAILFPLSPSELHPDWITDALRHDGCLGPSAACTEIDVDVLGGDAGAGVTGQLARVTLAYDDDDAIGGGAPASLIAKFSSTDPKFRLYFRELGVQEAFFYERIAPASDVRVPRCYVARYDRESGAFFFLLEDFRDWESIRSVDGADETLAERVVSDIAAFHARWWERPEVHEHRSDLFARLMTDDFLYGQVRGWKEFRNRTALDARSIAVHEAAMHFNEAIRTAVYWEGPRTLIHWDIQLDNMFARRDEDGGLDLAIIDWAGLGPAKAPYDMAIFLGGNLAPSVSAGAAKDLLASYHRDLVAQGVPGYDFDACLRDFRLALLDVFLRTMYVAMFFELTPAQREGMVATMLPRLARSVERFGALKALETLTG